MPSFLSPEEVRECRKPLNLRTAARLCGLHHNTLNQLELGRRPPSAAQVKALTVLKNCIEEFL